MNTQPINDPTPSINLLSEIADVHAERRHGRKRQHHGRHAMHRLWPIRGDLGWAYIPFTNGRGAKLRPVLVLGVQGPGPDLVIAPLTSHPPRDEFDIEVEVPAGPGYRMPGTVRCSRIASISSALVVQVAGRLGRGDWQHVVAGVATWLRTVVTYDLGEPGFSA